MSKHNKQNKDKLKFLDKLISSDDNDVSKVEQKSPDIKESWLNEDGTIMLSFLFVFFILCYVFRFSLAYVTPLLIVAFIMYKVRKVAMDSRKFRRICRKIKVFIINTKEEINRKFRSSSNEEYGHDYRLLDV